MRTGAVIAAAGLSSRMGEFKPMLPIGGQSAVRKLIHTIQSAGVDPVVVVTGYQAPRLEAHLRDLNVTCLRNENYARTHMLDSARLGFSFLAAQCDRVLFTPADIPLVRRETVEALLGSAAPVAIPTCGGRTGHPILLRRDILERILADAGGEGLKGAIRRSGAEIALIPVEDRCILLDMDTPEDYQNTLRQAAALFRESGGPARRRQSGEVRDE